VLFTDRVQSELRAQSAARQSSVELQSIGYQKLLVDSRQFLLSMTSKINPNVIQAIFFMFHTVFKRVFDQVIIDDSELRQVKQLLSKKGGGPVILVPSFKSYMDMILIQYINIVYGLDLAFLSGNKEWADITLVSQILKLCGGFFLERKKIENPLYQVLVEEFLAAILKQRYIIGYQIERRRQRSGKVVKP
jgi:glycerol-3-phosphate O-acyltransferase